MANYRISETAKADLRRIYRRGVRQHGEAQADRYYDAFLSVLSYWQSNPICTKLLMTFEKDIDEVSAAWTVSTIALTVIPLRS